MKLNSSRVRAAWRSCTIRALFLLLPFLPASPVTAATLGWIGYTYSFPSAGSVDPSTDLFINTETAPHGAAVSALVSYSTDGGTTWHSVAMSANGLDGSNSNDEWHVDLGRFAEGTLVQYKVQATDSLSNSLWDNNYGQNFYVKVNTLIRDVYTDKARYNPGDTAQIFVNLVNANAATATGQVRVTINRLFTSITNFTSTVNLGSGSGATLTFSWPTLTNDFRGYSVDVDFLTNGIARDSHSGAIDVSSSRIPFPRYGFFTDLAPGESAATSSNTVFTLSKYHINAAIFYDWMWSHDRLIDYGAGSNIVNNFTDWGGSSKSITVITNRIQAAKNENMSPIAYDLMYGDSGNTNAAPEQITWAAFRDPGHTDVADVTNQNQQIWIMDVSNSSWQSWIFNQFKDAMTKLGFEGFHLDNLGAMTAYKYNSSQSINESIQFPNFINACKPQLQTVNSKATVTENDVAGNYLSTVAPSAEDIYYSEVWGWDHYNDIRTLIQNAKTAGGGKPVVLAAYMNYQSLAQPTDTLNEASVRLMDACVFANGAFHIELGEGNPVQMLTTYYWPTHSPPMPPTLPQVMRNYYDFNVRYENLLFSNAVAGVVDGTSGALISSTTHTLSKDAESNTIWTVVQLWPGTYDTVNLINLYGVDNVWRNLSGTPTTQTNIHLKYYVSSKVYQVYVATPDDGLGRPQPLAFTDGTDGQGYYVQVTVPQLQYWDLLVFDRTTEITVDGSPSDWTGAPGPLIHQVVTSQGEWIYTGDTNDYRTFAGASPDEDITQVRVTSDANFVYFLVEMAKITNSALPAVGIAWNSNGSVSGNYPWIGDSSTPTGSIGLGTNVQYATREIMFYTAGSVAKIRMWNGGSWYAPPSGDSAIVVSATNSAIEARINVNDLGLTYPAVVAMSLASFRSSGNDAGSDCTYDCPDNNNDAVDVMGGDVGVSMNAWQRDLSDNTINRYYLIALSQQGSGPPAPPLTLSATLAGFNQINLAWPASSGATGYVVKRGGGQLAVTTTTNYSDMGLAVGTTYCYTVAATNVAGVSGDSAQACVTTPLIIVATNLLARWTFDEGSGSLAYDSAGYGNTGTVVFGGNGGGWTSGGMVNGGLYVDGDGTQVIVSNSASLNPVSGITVCAWVQNANDAWYNTPRILEKGKTDNQYALFINSSGSLEFLVAGVSGGAIAASPPSSGAWHHLAGTYDGSSLISLYIDGQLATQQVASGLMPVSADPLAIGNRPGGSLAYQLYGLIDDVRIYGGALPPSQIARLYNIDSVGDGIANWWRMQYFGDPAATDATTCATCDFDGTGQNNLFKFVAGLDPTDPAQVFTLQIAPVAGQPTKENLSYAPLAVGRTYTLQSTTNMVGGAYSDLSGFTGPQTNGSQATVTDQNAAESNKFYRVHISLP